MTPAGIRGVGQKSNRTRALELHREGTLNPSEIARALDVEEEQIKDWIYPKPRKSTKRTGSISPASMAQRRKIKGRPSILPGEGPIDPMHLWPRSLGGCDDPLCVVPGARTVHRAFDAHELDILPALIAHRYVAEIAHAVEHANGDLIAVLERLTSDKWYPRTTGLPE